MAQTADVELDVRDLADRAGEGGRRTVDADTDRPRSNASLFTMVTFDRALIHKDGIGG
jgi:hypothetical protein